MVMTVGQKNYSDVHFTNSELARRIINHFAPSGRCLEPFRGDGAFFNHLPSGSDWCEISDGRDFFEFSEQVDWIITNPPFSIMTRVFEHAFTVSENCVFLVPICKFWSSAPRLAAADKYGGLVEILHTGTGRDIGFDIGFPFAALHFKRGYKGAINQKHILS